MIFGRSDARTLARAVRAAGGQMPEVLDNLLTAINEVHAAGRKPVGRNNFNALADAAVAGKATTAKIASALDSASSDAAAKAQEQRAQIEAERALVRRFRTELVNGGADAILDSLRSVFDEHVAGIRAIAENIDVAISPEAFLKIATPETLALYQSVDQHVEGLNRIARVADLLAGAGVLPKFDGGPRLASEIASMRGRYLFCTHGIDLLDVKRAWGDDHPHLRSPWFRLHGRAKLLSVAEATERLRGWAEAAWDSYQALQATRLTGDVEDAPQPNPFHVQEAV
ncbi:hypothetical protein [Mycolicibacterium sp.]|uniref:hypothetical protein n=1 Tax=Mycolicibacterium sp. TaxID=2320850 RepID=UPI0037CAE6BF